MNSKRRGHTHTHTHTHMHTHMHMHTCTHAHMHTWPGCSSKLRILFRVRWGRVNPLWLAISSRQRNPDAGCDRCRDWQQCDEGSQHCPLRRSTAHAKESRKRGGYLPATGVIGRTWVDGVRKMELAGWPWAMHVCSLDHKRGLCVRGVCLLLLPPRSRRALWWSTRCRSSRAASRCPAMLSATAMN